MIEALVQQYHDFPWSWQVEELTQQISDRGYQITDADQDDADQEWLWAAADTGPDLRVHLEAEAVIWVELILSAYPDPHLLDEVEFAAKQEEYEQMFKTTVEQVTALLGTPVFVGAAGEAGFPDDQWADWAAVWTGTYARIMIQQKHNDKELPLELCLVFAPFM